MILEVVAAIQLHTFISMNVVEMIGKALLQNIYLVGGCTLNANPVGCAPKVHHPHGNIENIEYH